MKNVNKGSGNVAATAPGVGRDYELEYDDQEIAVFFILEGEQCSEFFSFEEMEGREGHYLLINMFSPELRRGLGRRALEEFIDQTGGTVHVRDRWMTSSSDSSHVLPEAWPFVERMMAEGLIVSHDERDDEMPDEEYGGEE